jgi:hypothetical protein
MNSVFAVVFAWWRQATTGAKDVHVYWLTCIEEGVAVPPIVIKVKP